MLALVAGGAITMTSLGVATVTAAREDDRTFRNAGLLGGQSGMVLAPFVAHAIVGETRRGLWFSLPLLLPVAMQGTALAFFPDGLFRAPAGVQYTMFAAAVLSVFGSAFGVLDAARASERRPKSSRPSVAVVPMFGAGTTGVSFTGSL